MEMKPDLMEMKSSLKLDRLASYYGGERGV